MSNTKRHAHEMPAVYGTKELAEKLQRQSELVEETIDRLLKANKQLRTELSETKQKKADLEIKVEDLEDKVWRLSSAVDTLIEENAELKSSQ